MPQKTTWRKTRFSVLIKSALSGIFAFAKNEGTFDGANPVQDALLPSKARKAKETFAYDLSQILQILDVLPLLPKAAVGTASFVGLGAGELRGVEWQDYNGTEMTVSQSIWKSVRWQRFWRSTA